MAVAIRQLLWALLFATLSLPVVYVLATLALVWLEHGYVRVDPALLRRISFGLAVVVFVGTFLLERLR